MDDDFSGLFLDERKGRFFVDGERFASH